MAIWSFFGGPHQSSVHILLGNVTKDGLKRASFTADCFAAWGARKL
jgi:hypothetical protein